MIRVRTKMKAEGIAAQAHIKDRRNPNLHLLAASQTWEKDVLTSEGTERILGQLKQESEYVALDSPAWI